jgi:hypothetical protein
VGFHTIQADDLIESVMVKVKTHRNSQTKSAIKEDLHKNIKNNLDMFSPISIFAVSNNKKDTKNEEYVVSAKQKICLFCQKQFLAHPESPK